MTGGVTWGMLMGTGTDELESRWRSTGRWRCQGAGQSGPGPRRPSQMEGNGQREGSSKGARGDLGLST